MPRPGRVFVEGGVYHVYNRVARGEGLFADENEAARFVSLLREVKERDGLTVFAWALMSNHYHLAVRSGAVPLERPMRSLQQRFTRDFNLRHQVFGPLWQGRYRAMMVKDQLDLDRLLAYIHLNPVTAGVVADPTDYRWSGHRDLIGRSRHPLVDVDEVLLLFGGTRRTARARYVRALRGALDEEWIGEEPGRLPWWRLGRPPAGEDEEPRRDPTRAFVDELGRSTGLERPWLEAGEFVERGARFLGVPLDDLTGRGRTPEVVRVRELLATLGVERYRLRVRALAKVLGKSPEAVSRCLSRGTRYRQTDVGFSQHLEALDRYLSSVSGAGEPREDHK